MLGLPPSVRIYYAREPVDMRKGIDGLRTRVEFELRKDPYERHLFVFVGKRRDKVPVPVCGGLAVGRPAKQKEVA